MKTTDTISSPLRRRRLMRILIAISVLAGGLFIFFMIKGWNGPDICKCLEEADKENPDQAIMDECREAFSAMEMDEVQKAVEECDR